MRFLSLLLTAMIVSQSISFAQNDLKARFDSLSLKGQFEYVYDKSESYERYKVVKMSTLNLLKQNSIDSIDIYKTELKTRKNEIVELKNTVVSKDERIKQLSDDLEATNTSKNSMMILGSEISKGAYSSIMWGLVFGLLALTTVLFLMYKRSNSVTNETKHRLNEVEEEFETHRKSALKREQKLARELMDEKLKHKF
ncbi:hypothetical protein [Carboxylicivirga marina]|uniref:tRNA (Guanine-N1)-methyltransferase n=1 Tax=Carboxylicivirga marina TaxID=2800988 RepID=A0ABS1HNU1_9BACT|nr:hypothetical protein [Carboxylicivirga marina]MBK3518824.1 hypothetical protein [Carboxylicivirga marina]